MRINKKICPVCGTEKLNVSFKKLFGITVRWYIRCRYCCHHAEGSSMRKAYSKFWKDALNKEELKGDSLYV